MVPSGRCHSYASGLMSPKEKADTSNMQCNTRSWPDIILCSKSSKTMSSSKQLKVYCDALMVANLNDSTNIREIFTGGVAFPSLLIPEWDH